MTRKKRDRARPPESFENRLQAFAEEARMAARKLPPGRKRETLIEKARQTETVMEVSEWLTLCKIMRPNGPPGRAAAMIEEKFDSRTLAAMNAALDRVCADAPHGEEHATRKRVAKYIIKCAKSGRTTLPELTEAGQQALANVTAAA